MEQGKLKTGEEWKQVDPVRFWRQIGRDQHVLQVYDNPGDLITSLFSFVDDGFKSNDAVLIISTPEHREMLDEKLRLAGHNVFSLRLQDQYICLDASETLAEFMIHGSPDPLLFRYAITDLVKRAKRSQRQVRAFGEMVAILWAAGNQDAALALEELWNSYMDVEPFTLFCAYPNSDVSGDGMFEQVQHTHKRCIATQAGNPLVYKCS
jgi:hypothetical protein